MIELELEKTYLLKYFPKGIEECLHKEIIDIYYPKTDPHPKLRIRKSGGKIEITKKEQLNPNDASGQYEHTIKLNNAEYLALTQTKGLKIRKIRYWYYYQNMTAEIDVFQNKLDGLVLVDFEFVSVGQKNSFAMPDFCLAEVTQKEFAAGGRLCGKKYSDIENELKKFNYSKISLKVRNQKTR